MASITVEMRVFREGDTYVALCPELDVSSFGDNIESAKESLKKALAAFFEECEARGTLQEVLEEAGFVNERNRWVFEEPVIMEP